MFNRNERTSGAKSTWVVRTLVGCALGLSLGGSVAADGADINFSVDNSLLRAWMHTNTHSEGAVPLDKIRQSSVYATKVATADQADNWHDSFVYMSIPRAGKGKQGYTETDGAEFAADNGMSVSWTSFQYSQDTWVEVDLMNGGTIESADDIIIRPTRLDFDVEMVDESTVKVLVPYAHEGYRFSVEFPSEQVTSYNSLEGFSGTLTTDGDAGHPEVHTEPRNAMMVFAVPHLSDEQTAELVPNKDGDNVLVVEPGQVPNLDEITQDTVYFGPGTYYMPSNYHAYLPANVNWVYLAPGAYVKGAFQFRDGPEQYKVTGYGVLSGENYVYEADTRRGYRHNIDSNCHETCVKMLRFESGDAAQELVLHGITVHQPPYHSFVVYGNESQFAMDVEQYKQVGGWYWQTDGLELYTGSEIHNSFFHSNDDVIKIYHSDVEAKNIQVWKVENGPVVQWGWWPREIDNVLVEDVDVIHNRIYWKDQKYNTCLINSSTVWYDMGATNTGVPEKTIKNVTIRNLRSEGKSPCAMRLYAVSSWENILIDGLYIEKWSDMSAYSQESLFKVLTDKSGQTPVSIGTGENGVHIHNFMVDGQPVTKNNDSWKSDNLGRFDFDISLWDNWAMTSDQTATCETQSMVFQPIADMGARTRTYLDAVTSSGLPVKFYMASTGASIKGDVLKAGKYSDDVTVVALQEGDDTYCPIREEQIVSILGSKPMYIGGSWQEWKPKNLEMDYNGTEYTALVSLPEGYHEMKFADSGDWSGEDWGNVKGFEGTTENTTGGAPNISFTIEEAGDYLMVFNPETLVYSITKQ